MNRRRFPIVPFVLTIAWAVVCTIYSARLAPPILQIESGLTSATVTSWLYWALPHVHRTPRSPALLVVAGAFGAGWVFALALSITGRTLTPMVTLGLTAATTLSWLSWAFGVDLTPEHSAEEGIEHEDIEEIDEVVRHLRRR